MEPEGSLPHSQTPTTCPYPEPDQSSPCPHPTSRRSILILPSHLRLDLPSGLFHSDFFAKTVYAPLLSPISVTCPAHLILLDSIIRIVFAEEYRSFSSSLCSLLYFLVTSSLLSPYILLFTLISKTLRLRSPLNESDKFSHPDNTAGKIIHNGGRSSTCNLRTRHAAVTVRTYHGASMTG